MQIPAFLQIILWVAAGLTALGVIFYKGVRPISRFLAQTERSIPILKEITDKLDAPNIIDVIVDMANQFKTNSGSSLRDVVDRLEKASKAAKDTTDSIREHDRAVTTHLIKLLERLQADADAKDMEKK